MWANTKQPLANSHLGRGKSADPCLPGGARPEVVSQSTLENNIKHTKKHHPHNKHPTDRTWTSYKTLLFFKVLDATIDTEAATNWTQKTVSLNLPGHAVSLEGSFPAFPRISFFFPDVFRFFPASSRFPGFSRQALDKCIKEINEPRLCFIAQVSQNMQSNPFPHCIFNHDWSRQTYTRTLLLHLEGKDKPLQPAGKYSAHRLSVRALQCEWPCNKMRQTSSIGLQVSYLLHFLNPSGRALWALLFLRFFQTGSLWETLWLIFKFFSIINTFSKKKL